MEVHAGGQRPGAMLFQVRRTPGISCEAVPASERDGAGMRRHVHAGNHAAESFVSFIPLFDGPVASCASPAKVIEHA